MCCTCCITYVKDFDVDLWNELPFVKVYKLTYYFQPPTGSFLHVSDNNPDQLRQFMTRFYTPSYSDDKVLFTVPYPDTYGLGKAFLHKE